jgi:crotonobetainyl-CoA:carnitine CoA-transferase CaiB-like acyl-CoA transferase
MMDNGKTTALAGLRVLDLSRILAGPTATQLLGDLGAEVIKIERPGSGDDTRGWGPPFLADATGADSDLSAYFLSANRNKKSIAIDFTDPEQVDLLKRLVSISDVVIENYKPGDLARRGLGYEDMARIKPDLVWCSISGFGQTGPYRERTGYDFLIQAMGGMMSITGQPDHQGGQPTKVGVGIADVMCGMYATVGILAALRHRDATGEGQQIDLSLYDTQVAWLINAATNHLVSGKRLERLGNAHPNIAPYQTFPTADGELALAVGNDEQFRRFAVVVARPELADDPRFATNRDRVQNRESLAQIIAGALLIDSADAWIGRLLEVGVPAGRVAAVDEVLADPHTLAREMVITMEQEDGEPVRLLGNPLKLSATPVAYRTAPPHLDQHRAEILALAENVVRKPD